MNSDMWMCAGKREVRFYLDETEQPLSDYVAEWVEWRNDCKVIHRTLRSFMPADADPMDVRQRLLEMPDVAGCPVWFMGALRHLCDHAVRGSGKNWHFVTQGPKEAS